MRRGVVIAIAILGVAVVILTVALASVGTELDQARIDADQLQIQVDDLQGQLDRLSSERETLQQQVTEQLKAVDQWKAEAEQARSSQGSGEASAPPSGPGSATP